MHAAVRQLPPQLPSITPEYLNYNKGPIYLAIVATLVSIALLTFLLRVYTRIKLLHFFGIDDWVMLVAVLCAVGVFIVFLAMTRLGTGKHLWAVPMEDLLKIAHWQWYFTLLIIIGISFVKLSVAFFLLRIIHRPYYRRFLYVMIGVLVSLTLAWCGTLVFQCVPVSAAWNPTLAHARCFSDAQYRSIGLANSSFNAATDLIFAILPIPIVWTLCINLRTRISLIIVLSLGFLACAAAIVRMPMIYNLWDSEDPFAYGVWLDVWSVIEMTIGITAACLPSLKPLLTALSNLTPSRRTSRSSNHMPHHAPHPSDQSRDSPFPSFTRPKHAYIRRFHDHESSLDFDLETPPPRTQNHSRNPSGLTNFSMPFDNAIEHAQPGTASRGTGELEDEVGGWRGGYAVSITSGETPSEGKEEDGRAVRRVASVEESVVRLGCGGGGMEEMGGGIVRTTTTEVTIT